MCKNRTKRLTGLAVVCVLGAAGILSACSTDQLPNDATLRLSPSSKKIDINAVIDAETGCAIDRNFYQDIPVFLSMVDAQGTPIGNADVGVYVDYSANTFGGPDVLQLYNDNNGNGVVDGESELVSGSDSGVFVTRTGRYSGNAMVLLRMNLSCPYKGEVYVFSGPHTALMSVQVAIQSDNGTATSTASGNRDDD